jgi:hypothetical protein
LNEFGDPYVGGWWIGLIIGSAIVVVIVAVVGALLVLASQINEQVRAAVRELDVTLSTTRSLVELGRTNATIQSILSGARTARQALGG